MIKVSSSEGLRKIEKPQTMARSIGAHIGPSMAAVDYIVGQDNSAVMATFAPGSTLQSYLLAYPFISPSFSVNIARIGFEVTTAQAGSTAKIGLFEDSGLQSSYSMDELNTPGAMLADSGSIATDSTGIKSYAVSGMTLAPSQIHWLVLYIPAGIVIHATFRAVSAGNMHPFYGGRITGTTFQNFLSCNSTINAFWGHYPHIPSVAWSASNGGPALRYGFS